MPSPSEHRLPFEAPIYEMEARLAEMETQYAKNRAVGRQLQDRRADPPAPPRAGRSSSGRSTRSSIPGRSSRSRGTPSAPRRATTSTCSSSSSSSCTATAPSATTRRSSPGWAYLDDMKVMFVGHQKGKNLAERTACHFGCAHPEGYRKALLKMRFAAKFGLPIVTFIDTPGAYPGISAEERGQAAIIAESLMEMSQIRTPIVCVVIGEGGSGGALGIGIGDRLGMLEHTYYSVISPEGCASILWKGSRTRPQGRRRPQVHQPRPAPLRHHRRDHPRAPRRRPPRPPRGRLDPQVFPPPQPPRAQDRIPSTTSSTAATRNTARSASSPRPPPPLTPKPQLNGKAEAPCPPDDGAVSANQSQGQRLATTACLSAETCA